MKENYLYATYIKLQKSPMFIDVYIPNAMNKKPALAGMAQWIECRPVNQSTGLIPSQGTCLRCGPGPQ